MTLSRNSLRGGASVCAVLALLATGCAGNRVASRAPEVIRVAQSERQLAVAVIENFSFAGRVAVSNGRDGGSAQIEWQQDGARADITLRAPV
ncbi:MAG: lipoprotein insertase outer membrane protein LolB, partial [Lysobacterales bacterium]